MLRFKNKTLDLSTPAVMGILNVTPDSFYDGGKYTGDKALLLRAEQMISEGADILDLGGCSTRPGAEEVSEEEELKRLIPAIRAVRNKFPDSILSADTFRSRVAREAIEAGADLINDVSGGSGSEDAGMYETVARLNVPYVLMHRQGTPKTMQKNPQYRDVVNEVKDFFIEKITTLQKYGASQIILDPGFGFGKNMEHNYILLKNLAAFQDLRLPILAGISRKSMINQLLGTKPETALNGTTVAHTLALLNGANLLRVHDVKEAKQAIKMINYYQKI